MIFNGISLSTKYLKFQKITPSSTVKLYCKFFYLSLGPHCAYFCMRTLKPQVAKAATVASVMRDK